MGQHVTCRVAFLLPIQNIIFVLVKVLTVSERATGTLRETERLSLALDNARVQLDTFGLFLSQLVNFPLFDGLLLDEV